MELWTLREWKERSQYEISVTTTNPTAKRGADSEKSINEKTIITHADMQRIFGVWAGEMSKQQLYMITYMYMNTLALFDPARELAKGCPKEDEDSSEDEARVIIKQGEIESVYAMRRMIRIDKNKLTPVTISLLGCNAKFLGIRVVIYDSRLC